MKNKIVSLLDREDPDILEILRLLNKKIETLEENRNFIFLVLLGILVFSIK